MDKIVFSGVQPSGTPSIANYLGAIKNWINLQNDYKCLYCVVDLHSLTVKQEASALRKKSKELLALYLACGVDPEKSLIYYQSAVKEHTELAWILNCHTYMGELSRMTQFKDKAKNAEGSNAGLFTYPVLMAADILLFKTSHVPIGDDQRQHLELCRDIAIRFNNMYGDVFVVPEPIYNKTSARIMSLGDPSKKMSKTETENLNNVIFLLDDAKTITSKIKKSVTDSEAEIAYAPHKLGINNLLSIYSSFRNITIEEACNAFKATSYGEFKLCVADAIIESLTPIQQRYNEIIADKTTIEKVAKESAETASYIANKNLSKVKRKLGLL